jgi:hypothetical protein
MGRLANSFLFRRLSLSRLFLDNSHADGEIRLPNENLLVISTELAAVPDLYIIYHCLTRLFYLTVLLWRCFS